MGCTLLAGHTLLTGHTLLVRCTLVMGCMLLVGCMLLPGHTLLPGSTAALERPRTGGSQAGGKCSLRSEARRQTEALGEQDASPLVAFAFSEPSSREEGVTAARAKSPAALEVHRYQIKEPGKRGKAGNAQKEKPS